MKCVQDYETKKEVKAQIKWLDKDVADRTVCIKRYRGFCQNTDEKMNKVQNIVLEVKEATQNHTKHIQANKDAISKMATSEAMIDIHEQMKTFAVVEEFKELYDKVVPPISIVETKVDKLLNRVQKLNSIVKRFDEAITIKANK